MREKEKTEIVSKKLLHHHTAVTFQIIRKITYSMLRILANNYKKKKETRPCQCVDKAMQ